MTDKKKPEDREFRRTLPARNRVRIPRTTSLQRLASAEGYKLAVTNHSPPG